MPVERASHKALGDGHRESFGSAFLVTNASDGLRLRGDTEEAEALVAGYGVPGSPRTGWPSAPESGGARCARR